MANTLPTCRCPYFQGGFSTSTRRENPGLACGHILWLPELGVAASIKACFDERTAGYRGRVWRKEMEEPRRSNYYP